MFGMDPQTMALLRFMAAGADPRGTYGSAGASLNNAMNAGMGAFMQAADVADRKKQRDDMLQFRRDTLSEQKRHHQEMEKSNRLGQPRMVNGAMVQPILNEDGTPTGNYSPARMSSNPLFGGAFGAPGAGAPQQYRHPTYEGDPKSAPQPAPVPGAQTTGTAVPQGMGGTVQNAATNLWGDLSNTNLWGGLSRVGQQGVDAATNLWGGLSRIGQQGVDAAKGAFGTLQEKGGQFMDDVRAQQQPPVVAPPTGAFGQQAPSNLGLRAQRQVDLLLKRGGMPAVQAARGQLTPEQWEYAMRAAGGR